MNPANALPRHSCPSYEELSAFCHGRVSEAVVQAVADHLDSGCSSCRAALEELAEQVDAYVSLHGRAVAPTPFAEEQECRQVLERIEAIGPKRSQIHEGQGPPPAARIPQSLSQYQLLEKLGQGAMGTVYKALHPKLKRVVAIKVMSAERRRDERAVVRFQREIEAAGKLDHPHIVRATDAGEAEGVHFLVMEFVEGTDLSRLVKRRGPLPIADACELVRQAALGLHHAHENGLVHRDVKPSNLMLTADGQVKVLDLGLALLRENDLRAGPLTSSGQVVGTFDYMAPEQGLDTHRVDLRADVYSLGCTLYHLLTGEAPFSGPAFQNMFNKMLAHTQKPVPPVQDRRPDVSLDLARILDRLLAKAPEDRYASAAEVAFVLRPFAAGCDLPALLQKDSPPKAVVKPLEPLTVLPVEAVLPLSSPTVAARRGGNAQAAPPRRRGWYVGTAIVLLAVVGGVWAVPQLFHRSRSNKDAALGGSAAEKLPESVGENKSEDVPPPDEEEKPTPRVYPTAVFPFEERGGGVKDYGVKVGDILFAKLGSKPDLYLVDRDDLKKTLQEQELNLSGIVKPEEAVKVGQLTGAKLLITGSVFQVDKNIHIVAKIIGTETSRVVGADVELRAGDDLGPAVAKLAEKVAEALEKQSDKLVVKAVAKEDRVAILKKKLKNVQRPVLFVQVRERHVGQATLDPAAQTELSFFSRGSGFEVIDPDAGNKAKADIIITGEGFSELGVRHGNLITVKARVEVKAVDRKTDKVIAVDRQTAVAVDLTEQIAGKTALQEATAAIAERLLPKLAKEKED